MVLRSIKGKVKFEISKIGAATRSNNYIVLYLKAHQMNYTCNVVERLTEVRGLDVQLFTTYIKVHIPLLV